MCKKKDKKRKEYESIKLNLLPTLNKAHLLIQPLGEKVNETNLVKDITSDSTFQLNYTTSVHESMFYEGVSTKNTPYYHSIYGCNCDIAKNIGLKCC